MSSGVSTSNTDRDDVVHGSAEYEDSVARNIDVDGAGGKGGGGLGNDFSGVGDQCVRNGAGICRADGNGVVHGGAEDDDVGAREIDINGANSRGGSGIVAHSGGVGEWFVSEGVGISEADDDGDAWYDSGSSFRRKTSLKDGGS